MPQYDRARFRGSQRQLEKQSSNGAIIVSICSNPPPPSPYILIKLTFFCLPLKFSSSQKSFTNAGDGVHYFFSFLFFLYKIEAIESRHFINNNLYFEQFKFRAQFLLIFFLSFFLSLFLRPHLFILKKSTFCSKLVVILSFFFLADVDT